MSKVFKGLDGMLGDKQPAPTTIRPPEPIGSPVALSATIPPKPKPEARAALNIDVPVSLLEAVRKLARDRDVKIRDIVIQGLEIMVSANRDI